jgi:hypothetical protein
MRITPITRSTPALTADGFPTAAAMLPNAKLIAAKTTIYVAANRTTRCALALSSVITIMRGTGLTMLAKAKGSTSRIRGERSVTL